MTEYTTIRYVTGKYATCSDCGIEWDETFCEAKARQHAVETGHITTLHIQMDVSREPKP